MRKLAAAQLRSASSAPAPSRSAKFMKKLAAAQLRGGGATVFRAPRGQLTLTLVLDGAVAQTRVIAGTAVAVDLRRGERPGVLTIDRPKLRA